MQEKRVLNEKTMEENVLSQREYKYGFYTNIETERIEKGLNEGVIQLISKKKQEPKWLLDWRLKAYRHWKTLKAPEWGNFEYGPIDYQGISYYTVPKSIEKNKPKSLDEVDPELLKTFDRLGIPISEQKRLSGVAVDIVFDSVSVGTTHKSELEKLGIIFCSMGEAIREHPELVKKYMGFGCSVYR